MPVLSPQGDKLAFVAHSADSRVLWVRSLNDDTAQPLEGTQGAMHPFWSPDGRNIGFFAGNKLMKIPATGGPIVALADAANPRGGTWGANDIIVFEGDYTSGLVKVSAQGGKAEPATVIDKTKHTTHRWPWFLPDGKHFIFLATNHAGGDSRQNRNLLWFNRQPGHSLCDRGRISRAIRFRLSALSLKCCPGRATLRSTKWQIVGTGDFAGDQSARRCRSLAQYLFRLGERRHGVSGRQRCFGQEPHGLDRSYRPTLGEFDPDENTVIDPRLSPDNKRAAFSTSSGIWTFDLERKTKTRITFDQNLNGQASWSPDGKTIMFLAFLAKGGGNGEIRSKPADGSGSEKTVVTEQILPLSGVVA